MAEPAPAPAETATPEPAAEVPAEEQGLLDVLAALPETPEGDEAADTEPDTNAAKAKAAKKDAKPEPEKKSDAESEKPDEGEDEDAKLDPDEALFTDEALSTKDGVQRAAEVTKTLVKEVRRRHAILNQYDARIKKRDARTKGERDAVAAEKQNYRASVDAEIAPMREAARGVIRELQILDPRSGASAMDRFAALARLNGGIDGQQLYEQWTLGIASDGKMPAPSREVAELQAQIQEMRRALEQKAEAEAEGGERQKVEQLRQGVQAQLQEIRTIASDADKYPAIAAELAALPDDDARSDYLDEVVEWAKARMLKAHDARQPIDKATAIGRIEARLAARGGPKQATAAGTSPKPTTPTRGAGNGKTVLPTSADASSGHVKTNLTDAERDAENLRDPKFRAALPFLDL